MTPQFLSFLRSLAPFGDGLSGRETSLRSLRLALVVVALLNPVYWVVYRSLLPEAFDPLWVRLVVVGVSLVLLSLTYTRGAVWRHPRRTLSVLVYVLLPWYGYLVAANGLAPDYASGYQFVALSAAMVYSLTLTSVRPLAANLAASAGVAVAVVAVAEVGPTSVSPAGFLLVHASGSVVIFLAFAARVRAVRELEKSEARLAEAERLAGVGNWTFDRATGRREWSEGVYRIFGVPPSASAPSILDFIPPCELEPATEEVARLLQGQERTTCRFLIVRPDGETRTVQSIVTIADNRSGESGRLQGVLQDVTEQVEREAALEAARDCAEDAARAKAAFLANMSHEIRTPLTAIIGFAQMLGEEVGEEHADLVRPIQAGGERLLGTLNSVLDLARMEAGETDLVLVPADLAREAREVAALLRPQAEARGLRLDVDGPHELAVLADPDALARALTNLVSNAVKFTESGGITVALRATGDRVEVAVHDTGHGMNEAFLTRLFEPFRQASTGWARSHEGTGLGLTITRQLVHAMHGTISVESEVGVGTRFVVSLPAAAAVPTEPVEADDLSVLESAFG